jgi:hypothetical protein
MPAAVRRAIEPPVGCLADLAVLGDRLRPVAGAGGIVTD